MEQSILKKRQVNNIYIPSYNRSDLVRTYEYLGTGFIVVPESQKEDYKKKYGNAVLSIPDNKDGSVSKKRNAIIDLIKEKETDGYGFIIDDDMVALKRKKENIKLDGDQCLEILERLYIMAKDMCASFGGFDYSGDNMKLKDMNPFSLNKIIFGLTLVSVKDGLKYDERFRVNEDVEFYLQKMNSGRRLIKDNQYYAEFYGQDGGSDSVIKYTRNEQRKYATMINNKWGYKAMIWENNKFRFKIPIKGV